MVAVACEHVNELLGVIKDDIFVDCLAVSFVMADRTWRHFSRTRYL
jgi:hypothetical protein